MAGTAPFKESNRFTGLIVCHNIMDVSLAHGFGVDVLRQPSFVLPFQKGIVMPYPSSQEPENRGMMFDSQDLCRRLVMLERASRVMTTAIYLTTHIFEIRHA